MSGPLAAFHQGFAAAGEVVVTYSVIYTHSYNAFICAVSVCSNRYCMEVSVTHTIMVRGAVEIATSHALWSIKTMY